MKVRLSFKNIKLIFFKTSLLGLLFSCSNSNDNIGEVCANYPDWKTSPYILPFPVGNTFRISQGNCTEFSHQNTLKYSYDIEMPFGSYVTSARDGVVFGVRDTQPEGSPGLTASNWVLIRHNDGQISEYIHLKQNSALVKKEDNVKAGDTIALTGDTGNVGTWEHLHFDINLCGNNFACETLPVTFRNTTPNPEGLILNQHYTAESFN